MKSCCFSAVEDDFLYREMWMWVEIKHEPCVDQSEKGVCNLARLKHLRKKKYAEEDRKQTLYTLICVVLNFIKNSRLEINRPFCTLPCNQDASISARFKSFASYTWAWQNIHTRLDTGGQQAMQYRYSLPALCLIPAKPGIRNRLALLHLINF